MSRLDLAQIEMVRGARVAAFNFTASGSSNVVTTAITTVLSGAGQGGVSVPLQPSVSEGLGVVTTGALNRSIIVDNATQRPLADSNNNEVYGRLTESAGTYTLSYFTLVNGTETAYTFPSATAIDFYFAYRFDAHRLPRDSELLLSGRLIQQDPSGTGSFQISSLPQESVVNPFSDSFPFHRGSIGADRRFSIGNWPLMRPDLYFIASEHFTLQGAGANNAIISSRFGVSANGANSGISGTDVGGQLSTGTTSSGRAGFVSAQNALTFNSGRRWIIRMLVSLTAPSDATDSYIVRLGINSNALFNIDGSNFILLKYSHGLNGGRWQASFRTNSGAEQTQDCGVAPSFTAAGAQLIEIDTVVGTSVQIRINDTLVATRTTDLLSNVDATLVFGISKNAGTVSRGLIMRWLTVIGEL